MYEKDRHRKSLPSKKFSTSTSKQRKKYLCNKPVQEKLKDLPQHFHVHVVKEKRVDIDLFRLPVVSAVSLDPNINNSKNEDGNNNTNDKREANSSLFQNFFSYFAKASVNDMDGFSTVDSSELLSTGTENSLNLNETIKKKSFFKNLYKRDDLTGQSQDKQECNEYNLEGNVTTTNLPVNGGPHITDENAKQPNQKPNNDIPTQSGPNVLLSKDSISSAHVKHKSKSNETFDQYSTLIGSPNNYATKNENGPKSLDRRDKDIIQSCINKDNFDQNSTLIGTPKPDVKMNENGSKSSDLHNTDTIQSSINKENFDQYSTLVGAPKIDKKIIENGPRILDTKIEDFQNMVPEIRERVVYLNPNFFSNFSQSKTDKRKGKRLFISQKLPKSVTSGLKEKSVVQPKTEEYDGQKINPLGQSSHYEQSTLSNEQVDEYFSTINRLPVITKPDPDKAVFQENVPKHKSDAITVGNNSLLSALSKLKDSITESPYFADSSPPKVDNKKPDREESTNRATSPNRAKSPFRKGSPIKIKRSIRTKSLVRQKSPAVTKSPSVTKSSSSTKNSSITKDLSNEKSKNITKSPGITKTPSITRSPNVTEPKSKERDSRKKQNETSASPSIDMMSNQNELGVEFLNSKFFTNFKKNKMQTSKDKNMKLKSQSNATRSYYIPSITKSPSMSRINSVTKTPSILKSPIITNRLHKVESPSVIASRNSKQTDLIKQQTENNMSHLFDLKSNGIEHTDAFSNSNFFTNYKQNKIQTRKDRIAKPNSQSSVKRSYYVTNTKTPLKSLSFKQYLLSLGARLNPGVGSSLDSSEQDRPMKYDTISISPREMIKNNKSNIKDEKDLFKSVTYDNIEIAEKKKVTGSLNYECMQGDVTDKKKNLESDEKRKDSLCPSLNKNEKPTVPVSVSPREKMENKRNDDYSLDFSKYITKDEMERFKKGKRTDNTKERGMWNDLTLTKKDKKSEVKDDSSKSTLKGFQNQTVATPENDSDYQMITIMTSGTGGKVRGDVTEQVTKLSGEMKSKTESFRFKPTSPPARDSLKDRQKPANCDNFCSSFSEEIKPSNEDMIKLISNSSCEQNTGNSAMHITMLQDVLESAKQELRIQLSGNTEQLNALDEAVEQLKQELSCDPTMVFTAEELHTLQNYGVRSNNKKGVSEQSPNRPSKKMMSSVKLRTPVNLMATLPKEMGKECVVSACKQPEHADHQNIQTISKKPIGTHGKKESDLSSVVNNRTASKRSLNQIMDKTPVRNTLAPVPQPTVLNDFEINDAVTFCGVIETSSDLHTASTIEPSILRDIPLNVSNRMYINKDDQENKHDCNQHQAHSISLDSKDQPNLPNPASPHTVTKPMANNALCHSIELLQDNNVVASQPKLNALEISNDTGKDYEKNETFTNVSVHSESPYIKSLSVLDIKQVKTYGKNSDNSTVLAEMQTFQKERTECNNLDLNNTVSLQDLPSRDKENHGSAKCSNDEDTSSPSGLTENTTTNKMLPTTGYKGLPLGQRSRKIKGKRRVLGRHLFCNHTAKPIAFLEFLNSLDKHQNDINSESIIPLKVDLNEKIDFQSKNKLSIRLEEPNFDNNNANRKCHLSALFSGLLDADPSNDYLGDSEYRESSQTVLSPGLENTPMESKSPTMQSPNVKSPFKASNVVFLPTESPKIHIIDDTSLQQPIKYAFLPKRADCKRKNSKIPIISKGVKKPHLNGGFLNMIHRKTEDRDSSCIGQEDFSDTTLEDSISRIMHDDRSDDEGNFLPRTNSTISMFSDSKISTAEHCSFFGGDWKTIFSDTAFSENIRNNAHYNDEENVPKDDANGVCRERCKAQILKGVTNTAQSPLVSLCRNEMTKPKKGSFLNTTRGDLGQRLYLENERESQENERQKRLSYINQMEIDHNVRQRNVESAKTDAFCPPNSSPTRRETKSSNKYDFGSLRTSQRYPSISGKPGQSVSVSDTEQSKQLYKTGNLGTFYKKSNSTSPGSSSHGEKQAVKRNAWYLQKKPQTKIGRIKQLKTRAERRENLLKKVQEVSKKIYERSDGIGQNDPQTVRSFHAPRTQKKKSTRSGSAGQTGLRCPQMDSILKQYEMCQQQVSSPLKLPTSSNNCDESNGIKRGKDKPVTFKVSSITRENKDGEPTKPKEPKPIEFKKEDETNESKLSKIHYIKEVICDYLIAWKRKNDKCYTYNMGPVDVQDSSMLDQNVNTEIEASPMEPTNCAREDELSGQNDERTSSRQDGRHSPTVTEVSCNEDIMTPCVLEPSVYFEKDVKLALAALPPERTERENGTITSAIERPIISPCILSPKDDSSIAPSRLECADVPMPCVLEPTTMLPSEYQPQCDTSSGFVEQLTSESASYPTLIMDLPSMDLNIPTFTEPCLEEIGVHSPPPNALSLNNEQTLRPSLLEPNQLPEENQTPCDINIPPQIETEQSSKSDWERPLSDKNLLSNKTLQPINSESMSSMKTHVAQTIKEGIYTDLPSIREESPKTPSEVDECNTPNPNENQRSLTDLSLLREDSSILQPTEHSNVKLTEEKDPLSVSVSKTEYDISCTSIERGDQSTGMETPMGLIPCSEDGNYKTFLPNINDHIYNIKESDVDDPTSLIRFPSVCQYEDGSSSVDRENAFSNTYLKDSPKIEPVCSRKGESIIKSLLQEEVQVPFVSSAAPTESHSLPNSLVENPDQEVFEAAKEDPPFIEDKTHYEGSDFTQSSDPQVGVGSENDRKEIATEISSLSTNVQMKSLHQRYTEFLEQQSDIIDETNTKVTEDIEIVGGRPEKGKTESEQPNPKVEDTPQAKWWRSFYGSRKESPRIHSDDHWISKPAESSTIMQNKSATLQSINVPNRAKRQSPSQKQFRPWIKNLRKTPQERKSEPLYTIARKSSSKNISLNRASSEQLSLSRPAMKGPTDTKRNSSESVSDGNKETQVKRNPTKPRKMLHANEPMKVIEKEIRMALALEEEIVKKLERGITFDGNSSLDICNLCF